MAHRHAVQKKNVGGAAVAYGNPKVIAEAKSTANKKSGGAVVAKKKEGGPVEGRKSGGRLDKRARGGGIRKLATGGGADKSPFSSAHFAHKKG